MKIDPEHIKPILVRALKEIGLFELIEEIRMNRSKFEKPFLNIDELCEYTGLKKNSVYSLVHLKKIPYYKRTKHLFFKRFEIDEWLLDERYKTRSKAELEIEASTRVLTENQ